MRNRGPLTCVMFAFAMAVLSWNPVAAADQQGTLVVALDTLGGQNLDPILETRASHAHFQAPIFDSIVGFNFEEGGIGPGVAERWELAKDGLSWTFFIRKGQRWHNGDPVTAHDVKFSLERTMSKESVASRVAALRRNIKSIEVIDDYTVRVFTNGVQVHFPASLSRAVFQEGQMMPKKYIEKVGAAEFRKNPIGSGPWKFVKSVPGDRIEYEAVDYPHWRGTPKYKHMTLLLVPEESTRVAMVRTGEAAIASIGPDSLKEVNAAKLKIVSVPATMQAVYYFWGTYRPDQKGSPVADKRVREALSLAIDRQQIIDHVMNGEASWPMPFATFGYSLDTDIEHWRKWSKEALRYDPKRAKELLAEAGYADGFNLKFANTALPGTPYMVQIGLAVADFWTKIGVKIDYKHYEWGAFRSLRRGQKELRGAASMYRTAGRPVALARYRSAFGSKSLTHLFGNTKGDDNLCNEICQKFDKQSLEVAQTRDDEARTEKMNQLIKLASDTWVAVPIIEGKGYWAVNPKKVGAFKPIPGRHEFGDVFERMPHPEQKPWQ